MSSFGKAAADATNDVIQPAIPLRRPRSTDGGKPRFILEVCCIITVLRKAAPEWRLLGTRKLMI